MIDNTGYLYPGYMGQAVGPGGQDLGPAMSLADQAAERARQAAAAASAGRAAAAASAAAGARGQAQEAAQAAAVQKASDAAAVRHSPPAPVSFFRSPAFLWTAAAVGGVVILGLALKPAAPKTYFVRR